jgi:hypothetical protein
MGIKRWGILRRFKKSLIKNALIIPYKYFFVGAFLTKENRYFEIYVKFCVFLYTWSP